MVTAPRDAHKLKMVDELGVRCQTMTSENYSQLQTLTDEAAMLLIQAGHTDAIDVLYRRHYTRVTNYLIFLGRDTDAAKDLAHTAFIRIIEKKASFDPKRGQFSDWILTIAKRQRLGLWRSMKRAGDALLRLAKETILEERPSTLFRFIGRHLLAQGSCNFCVE